MPENIMQDALDDALIAIEAILQKRFYLDYFRNIPGISKYTVDLQDMYANLCKWKEADKEYWEKRDQG